MLAVATASHHDWVWFWENLDRAEEVWASKLGDEGRRAFEVTVESMVRASIHPGQRSELREAWKGSRLLGVTPWDDGDLRWNL